MQPPIEITKELPHAPVRVFEAFTSAAALAQWFCPPGGECIVNQCDAQMGGIYRFHIRIPSAQFEFGLTGVFLFIDAPKSMTYSWRWEQRPGFPSVSKVDVEFRPASAGTSLFVKHCGLATAAERDDHIHGWTAVLDRLQDYLAANTTSPSSQTR